MNHQLPLTGSDLRRIADAVDHIDDSLTTTGDAATVLGRVELLRPDGGDQVGWAVPFGEDQGWGYVPTETNNGDGHHA